MRRLFLVSISIVLILAISAVLAAQLDLNQAVTGRYDLSTGTFTVDTAGAAPYGVSMDLLRNEIQLLDPDSLDTAIPAVDLSLAAVSDVAFRVVSGDDGLVKVGDPQIVMMDASFGIIRGPSIYLDSIVITGNKSVIADANATIALYSVEDAEPLSGNTVLEDSSTSPKVYTVTLKAGDKIYVKITGGAHDVYIFFPNHAYTQNAISVANNDWKPVYMEWKKDISNGKKIWYPKTSIVFTAPQDGQYTFIIVKFTGNDNNFTLKVVKSVSSGQDQGNSGQEAGTGASGASTLGPSESIGNFLGNYGLYIAAGIGVIVLLTVALFNKSRW